MLEIGNDFYINIKPRLRKNELYNFSNASTDTFLKTQKSPLTSGEVETNYFMKLQETSNPSNYVETVVNEMFQFVKRFWKRLGQSFQAKTLLFEERRRK